MDELLRAFKVVVVFCCFSLVLIVITVVPPISELNNFSTALEAHSIRHSKTNKVYPQSKCRNLQDLCMSISYTSKLLCPPSSSRESKILHVISQQSAHELLAKQEREAGLVEMTRYGLITLTSSSHCRTRWISSIKFCSLRTYFCTSWTERRHSC